MWFGLFGNFVRLEKGKKSDENIWMRRDISNASATSSRFCCRRCFETTASLAASPAPHAWDVAASGSLFLSLLSLTMFSPTIFSPAVLSLTAEKNGMGESDAYEIEDVSVQLHLYWSMIDFRGGGRTISEETAEGKELLGCWAWMNVSRMMWGEEKRKWPWQLAWFLRLN
jgi:hypothetical protein